MKLTDVQILTRGKETPEKLERNKYLTNYWENIRNLFCLNLPNKYEFLGISKLNIRLGEFQGDPYESPSSNGIAYFNRADFCFKTFENLTESEKDELSLFYIESSFLAIAEIFKIEKEVIDVIHKAAGQVRKNNFEFRKEHKKTTKWNSSRNLRAVTEIHFKKGGIDAKIVFVNKAGNVLHEEQIMESRFWEAVYFNLWKGYWDQSIFKIEDRTNNLYYAKQL